MAMTEAERYSLTRNRVGLLQNIHISPQFLGYLESDHSLTHPMVEEIEVCRNVIAV